MRRILGLEALAAGPPPGRPRGQLPLPATVVERAVRLVEHNGERFAKTIRAGPAARAGWSWRRTPRTRRSDSSGPSGRGRRRHDACGPRPDEPGAAARGRGRAGARPGVPRAADRPAARVAGRRRAPRWRAAGRARRPSRCWSRSGGSATGRDDDAAEEVATAMLGWAAAFGDLAAFVAAIDAMRSRLAELRRDDAPLTLATAHATKGLEFDHVIVVGMEAGRFPERAGRQPGRGSGPRVRGGTASRLRGVDPGTPVADAPVRPGGPLPVPARGLQPGELGLGRGRAAPAPG